MASIRKKKLFKMWMDHKKKKNPISIFEELMKTFERRHLREDICRDMSSQMKTISR